jgi:hypothetical protein
MPSHPSLCRVATLGLVLAWSWKSREARDVDVPRRSSGAREGCRDGRSARTGRHSASRARLFGPEPRAPARQGRTLRGRYGAACRAAPGAPVPARLGRPETGACPNRSSALHPPLRPLTARGCDSPDLSEPYPVSSTDASGASLVRPDLQPIAKLRTSVKNKTRTCYAVSIHPPAPGWPIPYTKGLSWEY